EFARQGQARRQGACGRRRVPERPDQKCGAVDPPADMAGDPVACLPSVPQRTPAPRAAPPRAKLMQPKREKSQTAKTSDRPTAVFRLTGQRDIDGDKTGRRDAYACKIGDTTCRKSEQRSQHQTKRQQDAE